MDIMVPVWMGIFHIRETRHKLETARKNGLSFFDFDLAMENYILYFYRMLMDFTGIYSEYNISS